ncbi:HTH-type transcriptional regulator SinR [Brevundimonas sp. SH203]|uniref:helix-turn-helix domain-containing protein n=1 Tax=Brevundimonas sp. SH203 TaxID=345167 RepID=UPI0009C70419|nr:HTH-type transcriptional regulator SinR [Brevundimonas sp. SH203]
MSNEPTPADLFTAAVGDRVREWREAVNQSRAELAGSAGISVGYLGKIERGKAAATITTIQAIAVALGASVSELLDVEGEGLGLAAKTASKPSDA